MLSSQQAENVGFMPGKIKDRATFFPLDMLANH